MTSEQIRELLQQVVDPELGINIIDLGLVYDIKVRTVEAGDQIEIRMTLTTPGCPMHDTIVGGVRRVLRGQKGIAGIEVDLVWEPRWTPMMISSRAKEKLGIM